MKKFALILLSFIFAVSMFTCSFAEEPPFAGMPSMEEIEAMTEEEREAFFSSLEGFAMFSEDAPEVKEGVKHIACIGDSITFGMGVMQTRDTEAWTVLLDQMVSDQWQVLNYGLSGRTLLNEGDQPYTQEDFYALSHETAADIYIIMLGTNDSKPYNWNAENYRKELAAFAESYRSLENHPQIYLMIPSKCFVVKGKTEVEFSIKDEVIHDEIMPIIQDIAKEYDYPVIDLYSATQDHPEWFDDGVHPNAEGNAAIAKVIFDSLNL